MKHNNAITKSPQYKLILAVVAVGFLGLLGSIIYASTQAGLGSELKAIWNLIWGKVTLLDLYLGLILSSMWVGYREKNPVVAIIWTLVFFSTGFLSVLLYVFFQLIALGKHSNTDRFFRGWRSSS